MFVKNRISRNFLFWGLITLLCILANSSIFAWKPGKVKNIILLIGDGMGTAQRQVTAYAAGKTLAMNDMPIIGLFTTHSANSVVTDSAAAATAFATGYKTNNGMLSVLPNREKVSTILEKAHEKGKSAGLVTVTTITHATPAAFAAHETGRGDEKDIALGLLQNKVEVMFGGGRNFFIPVTAKGKRTDKRNLIEEAKTLGYTYIETPEELGQLKSMPALGLFAKDSMSPELNRDKTKEPSLAQMTFKAIELLSKDSDGFFLMIEGGQIDWACHANDLAWTVTDTLAFDEAVQVAKEYAQKNKNTVVIVLGDHETGGLGLGIGNEYALNPEIVGKIKATSAFIAGKVAPDKSNLADVLKEYIDYSFTENEFNQLANHSYLETALNRMFSKKAKVGWTSSAHTAAPVPLTAMGPGSEIFGGYYDNTDVAKKMAFLMGLELDQKK